TLTFRAVADLGSASEFINVDINGSGVGTVFVTSFDCSIDQQGLTVPAATYNAAVNGGNATINMVPSAAVDSVCGPDSFISVKVEYTQPAGDCNNNSILDACEIFNNTVTDCNANGVPDPCDVTNGVLSDLDSNNIPDECDCNLFACPGDVDYDANVTGTD